jgi:hypothetical protein
VVSNPASPTVHHVTTTQLDEGGTMPGRNQVVVVDDLRSREQITITTAGGHKVVLDDNGRTVTITHSGGCSVTLTDTDVVVQANAQVKVTAPMVTVDSPMSKFSGVVECDTLIAQSVVSASYTPGAGNVW